MKCSAREIDENIKDILSRFVRGGKPTSKDVATQIKVHYDTYLSGLCRGRIYYAEILSWCKRTGVDPMRLFYKCQTQKQGMKR